MISPCLQIKQLPYLYPNIRIVNLLEKKTYVHPNFSESLDRLNDFAQGSGIEIYVTSSFRTSSNSQIRQISPATRSRHLIGYAIDVNVKYADKFYNSRLLSKYPNDLPDPVVEFIQHIIDDPLLEWGGHFNVKDPVHIGLIATEEEYDKIYLEMVDGILTDSKPIQ